MQDPHRFLTNGQLPRTSRERGTLLDQLRNFYLTQTTETMTKTVLPQPPTIDRLIAERKATPSNNLELLGMAESRVHELAADIKRNPSKYPDKNPLATAVLKEGLATIKREQAAAPAKRPVAAPAKLTHAARMAKMAPAEKTAYFRANEAGIRAETFKK